MRVGIFGSPVEQPRLWSFRPNGVECVRQTDFTRPRWPPAHSGKSEPPAETIGWRPLAIDRDRGNPRDSSPPTPPYIRVRIRRFAGLSADSLFCVRARGSDSRTPSCQLRSLRAAPSGLHPFPSLQRPVTWISAAWPAARSPHPIVFPAFRPSAKLVPPTMPSADFSARGQATLRRLSPVAQTRRRSPEVRSTAFACTPAGFTTPTLDDCGLRDHCSLVRPGRPRYPVLVHRAAALLHASFRPHLAMTPLRFANPSPPSGWIEDFHLQAVDHARRTKRKAAPKGGFPAIPTDQYRVLVAGIGFEPMTFRL